MRIAFALGAGIVSASTGLEHANDVCKVLTMDDSAICKDNRFCFVKNRKSWWPNQIEQTVYLCGDKAVMTLGDDYMNYSFDKASPWVLPHSAWKARKDCAGYVSLFARRSIGEMLPAMEGVQCSPTELSTLVSSGDAVDALEGILDMYRLFPLEERLTLSSVDVSFMNQLDAAKKAFPISIATGNSLVPGGPAIDHTQAILLGGMSADEILLLKAREPVNLSFGALIDLLVQIHSHVETSAPTWEKVIGTDLFTTQSATLLTQIQTTKDNLKTAANEVVLAVLAMISELDKDTAAEIKEYRKYKDDLAHNYVAQDGKYEAKQDELIKTRTEWNKTHRKNILIYLVHLMSNGIVAYNANPNPWM